LGLNGIHQLLIHADDVNIQCDNINSIKIGEALLKAGRKFGLAVNKRRLKFMVVFHHQNSGQNHTLLIANK
jgi:hypothetical protein